MSSIGSGGVSSIPDTDEKTKASQGQNSNKRVSGEKARFASSCRFRVPRRSDLSPVKLLKRIGDKVAAALHFVVSRRTRRSSPNASTGKSNPSIAPIDSHRAEAINDCIEFINSSSSLQRSSSVATNSS